MYLNHTIVHACNKEASAIFTGEPLGLPPPHHAGPFATVQVDAELSLDFIDAGGTTRPQHYAFLVTEAEFGAIFARVRERGGTYWADSRRREASLSNTWDDGRGVYFDDPNGHLLEVITCPTGAVARRRNRQIPCSRQRPQMLSGSVRQ